MSIITTTDGNGAAAYIAYAFSEFAAVYPITPSSPMAEYVEEQSLVGQKNIFGERVEFCQMQSEAGAAGALHGALRGGALAVTFTASQGLLLMIPNMYKIAGELLPAVFHISARALATHALSIFGDHQDVMACRQTGFALLCSSSVQEAADLAAVAHLSAIKSRVPFLHFFDGFRTSHEIQKVELLDYKDLKDLTDKKALSKFKAKALNPESPLVYGTAQNADIYFQGREAANRFYDAAADIVCDYMKKISRITKKSYKPFGYYGVQNATKVIVAMGSVCETISETVDYMTKRGERVGVVKVRLYRPFSKKYFFEALPKTVKKIAVLDRTKEPGSPGEPLYLDVCKMFCGAKNPPLILGGRYGLGSKDTTPSHIFAVFKNLDAPNPKNGFTVGITDDVTGRSLDIKEKIDPMPKDTKSCKFWGFGSDGTVGASKNSIKIIGDNTNLYVQAYFDYDSKKSGGVTVSHLRYSKSPIRSAYLVEKADFVACHKEAYVYEYDVLKGLKRGGTFLLNCGAKKEELLKRLPKRVVRYIFENKINFYIINASNVAEKAGLSPEKTNIVMQCAFFKLSGVMDYKKALGLVKEFAAKTYAKKGAEVVQKNIAAADMTEAEIEKIEISNEVKNAVTCAKDEDEAPDFVKKIVRPINALNGGKLPVSAFLGIEDGGFETGTSRYEKRGVAQSVPKWYKDRCISCNLCSLFCPHAAIRPVLLDRDEEEKKPSKFETKKAAGFSETSFRIQVSPLDCVGCGICAEICPAKEKALKMHTFEEQKSEIENWNYAVMVSSKQKNIDIKRNVKNSQFAQPLLEFSGACAGCGETPYIKLVTQLFGDRMIIANATGCSSIWGASAPSSPYAKNFEGKGPAWANSLFEDNAEFALGMVRAERVIRQSLENKIKSVSGCVTPELARAFESWILAKDDPKKTEMTAEEIKKLMNSADRAKLCSADKTAVLEEIFEQKSFLQKKSHWAIGGDGWAYDIGYGGLDHVFASGEDINILVLDTEVYSNTGGQNSKSTPFGASAKFASQGKTAKKKNLGMAAVLYKNVYTAQISLGADPQQALKAICEAEAYKGTSLIIAYAPCISHGIKFGMSNAPAEEKKAVEAGYWHLWRYNPNLRAEGKNPFVLDSKEPKVSVREFFENEHRFAALNDGEHGKELLRQAEEELAEVYKLYKNMSEQ